ncbi:MAG: ABC transporter permease [Myxococcota bacterium]
MKEVGLVASNTFRQVLREKTFLNIIVFGVGMVLLSVVISNITFGFQDRVVRSIGLSGVTIAVDLMALLVGVGLIHSEIDRKTLFVLLTRHMSRFSYVLGRAVGLALVLVLASFGFSLVFLSTLLSVYGTPSGNDLLALAGGYVEALILGSFGILLSSFTTPTLAAGIGLGFWIAASTTDDLVRLTQLSETGNETLAQVISWTLPNFQLLNYRTAAVYGDALDAFPVMMSFVYGLLYAAAFVAFAGFVLSRREMV